MLFVHKKHRGVTKPASICEPLGVFISNCFARKTQVTKQLYSNYYFVALGLTGSS